MSYQFSIWLDDKTARDLESLCHYEERKRGAMVKVLIRRAAKQLKQNNDSLKQDGIASKEDHVFAV